METCRYERWMGILNDLEKLSEKKKKAADNCQNSKVNENGG